LRRVVCDTGPLLHLREAASLKLLESAGLISVPLAVYSELVGHDPFWRDTKPDWVRHEAIEPAYSIHSLRWRQAGLLDVGEAEALALALQMRADWFLTDDAAARLIAQQQGFEVHGSLGVVLWGAATGLLVRAEAERSLEALSSSSLWIKPRVLQKAREALHQIYS
jgi:predicted nucleic acid-binding protein